MTTKQPNKCNAPYPGDKTVRCKLERHGDNHGHYAEYAAGNANHTVRW